MAFEKIVPVWNAPGTEPPETLKNTGFQVGYKPPADYFNWFWHAVSECLGELHSEALNNGAGVDISNQNIIDAVKGKSGFYRGQNVTNAPDQYWWYYLAVAGNDVTSIIAFGRNGSTLKSAQFKHADTSIEWFALGGIDGIVPIEKGGTGATTASAAANSLGVVTLLTGTPITADSAQDLNDYKTAGNYCCGQSAVAGNLQNCPTYNAFTMKVFYANGSDWYIGQEILDYSTGVRYYRLYKRSSDAWEEWKHSFNSAKKPTAGDVTAGTFAGAVIANSGGQTPGAYVVRNQKLSATEETPTVNGAICWMYE